MGSLIEARRRILIACAKKSRLPMQYQEVEYLSSLNPSTTAGVRVHINTGIIPTSEMRCVMKGITPSNVSSASFLFGSRIDSSSQRYWGITWQNTYRFGLGNRGSDRIAAAQPTEQFLFDFNFNSAHNMAVNGNVYTYSVTSLETLSLPIFVFSINNNGQTDRNQTHDFSVMDFQIYETYNDTIPIMHLVPCYRKADNTPGMYDLISGNFFTNQGAGEFIVGPEV